MSNADQHFPQTPPATPGGMPMSSQSAAEDNSVRVVLRRGERSSGGELDMTPMVDVTFLLLIFFMVTAAYSLQKSIEVPTPEPDEQTQQARTLRDIETDDDYIIVRVYRDNTIWIDGRQTPSEQELLVRLRNAMAKGDRKKSKLLVLADPEARHETVVSALDAGSAVGIESLRLATADEADLY
jgi:biopolymer transport protein ExbD